MPGFAYSEALSSAELVWTPATLNQWLERPSELVPGNRMLFAGVRKSQDRADLIAFLQQQTAAD